MEFLKTKFCATSSAGFFFLGFLSVEKFESLTLCVCTHASVVFTVSKTIVLRKPNLFTDQSSCRVFSLSLFIHFIYMYDFNSFTPSCK